MPLALRRPGKTEASQQLLRINGFRLRVCGTAASGTL